MNDPLTDVAAEDDEALQGLADTAEGRAINARAGGDRPTATYWSMVAEAANAELVRRGLRHE